MQNNTISNIIIYIMRMHLTYQYFKLLIHYFNHIATNVTSPHVTEFTKSCIAHTIINI